MTECPPIWAQARLRVIRWNAQINSIQTDLQYLRRRCSNLGGNTFYDGMFKKQWNPDGVVAKRLLETRWLAGSSSLKDVDGIFLLTEYAVIWMFFSLAYLINVSFCCNNGCLSTWLTAGRTPVASVTACICSGVKFETPMARTLLLGNLTRASHRISSSSEEAALRTNLSRYQ